MGNNLAEQQVNKNNKAKTKQQTQEQLSSPLSQVLKTYNVDNLQNCDLNTEIIGPIIHLHSHWYHMRRNLHKRASILLYFKYLWYIVILIQSLLKEIFLFKWRLIGDVVGFFIHPTAV